MVEVRTGTFEVRYYELFDLLPKPLDRVSLNTLSRPEAAAFGRLCESAGLPSPTLKAGKQSDFRDLLLELFDNKGIRERIEAALAPLFENRSTRRILAMTMLIATPKCQQHRSVRLRPRRKGFYGLNLINQRTATCRLNTQRLDGTSDFGHDLQQRTNVDTLGLFNDVTATHYNKAARVGI